MCVKCVVKNKGAFLFYLFIFYKLYQQIFDVAKDFFF